ncbi:hypothetical protein A9P82_05175 [Arachidicoccus ginsenosidimutans]|uniref:helix-turn-helix domain-containing protein n=1 Tax=Arachidicoccus sp. BS20 TaxID=1850526 RepID=UPI0007F12136|nr:helix-turn-helix domain-containing protein [Arachidicoccus sp. BS20]ANI88727.1 hypothetical protein A9P82_05175 [Arachidicoccus sp. BS20]
MPKDKIPKQLILPERQALKIISLKSYIHELSEVPHRHDHYQLLWITKGHGSQSIDGISYPMQTNRVFLIRTGQIHKMEDLQRDGWMILFSDVLYNAIIKLFPALEQHGLLDVTAPQPFIDLDEKGILVYKNILPLLIEEQNSITPDIKLLATYLSSMLITANNMYVAENNVNTIQSNEAKSIVKQAKTLLEQNFKTQQQTQFYSDKLNISPRKLNAVLQTFYGITMHDLIQKRLLMESCILLASSSMNIKEICYHLGFADPAYFNRFFKKYMSTTPANYREHHKL